MAVHNGSNIRLSGPWVRDRVNKRAFLLGTTHTSPAVLLSKERWIPYWRTVDVLTTSSYSYAGTRGTKKKEQYRQRAGIPWEPINLPMMFASYKLGKLEVNSVSGLWFHLDKTNFAIFTAYSHYFFSFQVEWAKSNFLYLRVSSSPVLVCT